MLGIPEFPSSIPEIVRTFVRTFCSVKSMEGLLEINREDTELMGRLGVGVISGAAQIV